MLGLPGELEEYTADFSRERTEHLQVLFNHLFPNQSAIDSDNTTIHKVRHYLESNDVTTWRKSGSVWGFNRHYRSELPTIAFLTIIDCSDLNVTNSIYNDRICGTNISLQSNLIAFLTVFLNFNADKALSFNLLFIAAETSNIDLIENVYPLSCLPPIDIAIVAEPTDMKIVLSHSSQLSHVLVRAGATLGCSIGACESFDQCFPFPVIKLGPGHPRNSEKDAECIKINELIWGIDICTKLFYQLTYFLINNPEII